MALVKRRGTKGKVYVYGDGKPFPLTFPSPLKTPLTPPPHLAHRSGGQRALTTLVVSS